MVSKKNMEKYATYKSMMENLSKAMRSEFYYQAIFIVCIMGLKPSPLGETFRLTPLIVKVVTKTEMRLNKVNELKT